MDVTSPDRRRVLNEKGGAWTIEVVGIALAIGALGFLLSDPEPVPIWAGEFAVALIPPAAFMYLGYRLSSPRHDPAERWAVARWTAVGIVLGTLAGGWAVVHQSLQGVVVADGPFLLVTMAGIGGLVGLAGGSSVSGIDRTGPFEAPRVPSDIGSHEAAEPASREAADIGAREGTSISEGVSDRLTRRWLVDTVLDDADRRRLIVLEYLDDTSDTVVGIDELADHLLVETDGFDEERGRPLVVTELHHDHLPRLDDHGFLTYDSEDNVVRTDR